MEISTIHCVECGTSVNNVIDTWGDEERLSTLIHECQSCGFVTGVHPPAEGDVDTLHLEVTAPSKRVYERLYGDEPVVYDARKAMNVDLTNCWEDVPENTAFTFDTGHVVTPGETVILPSAAFDQLVSGRYPNEAEFTPRWVINNNVRLLRGGSEVAERFEEYDTYEEDYERVANELEQAISNARDEIGPRYTARIALQHLIVDDDEVAGDVLAEALDSIESLLFTR